MKKTLLLLVATSVLIAHSAVAQSVAINTDGSLPNSSSILDIKSTNKGLLIPRMLLTQRNGIASPATGLLIYQTDNTAGYYYYNGTGWLPLAGAGAATNYWTLNGNNIFNNTPGNVGIGTNTPSVKLAIQTPINSTGWTHTGGADSIIVSEGIGGVSASIGTSTYHAFRINAGGTGKLQIYPTGDVVVGDNNVGSFGKFTVQTLNNSYGISHLGEGGNILATRIGGSSAGFGTFSNTNMRIFSNSLSAIFIAAANGNVGIGITDDNPLFKMDIADRIRIRSGTGTTAGLWLNNPANTATVAFMGIKDVDVAGIYGNGSGWGLVMNTNTGDVAVGNQNPVAGYKLSVQGNQYINGLIATTGDAEIGADLKVSGNLNVSGYIGIGGTPSIPLEVYSSVLYNPLQSWTYYGNGGFTSPYLAIRAHGHMMADVFVSISDARIKNIIGASNSAKDLETIRALKITDYTMKDNKRFGNRPFKKVIAQEVEKVYPQVITKNIGFIPNVYAAPVKIEETLNGYLLSFTNNHNLSKEAKKIQLFIGRESKEFDIVSVPSENQVIINAKNLKPDKIFVYGEEVDDFRTVDYEGLTTLNISATQELSKQLKTQQTAIDAQNVKIAELVEEIKLLKGKKITALQTKNL